MNIEDVLKLVRPNILGLEAYSTARDDCGSNQPEIFLDANENPYNNGINRYPDPHQKALKAKVAESIASVSIEKSGLSWTFRNSMSFIAAATSYIP